MAKIKAVQVAQANAAFAMVEREVPEPGRGQVRIKVEACGICHSDAFVKVGRLSGAQAAARPRARDLGRIDAVCADVTAWKEGERVGVGWEGRHCFECEACQVFKSVLDGGRPSRASRTRAHRPSATRSDGARPRTVGVQP
jgi:D-arabinose 1-dehydrogenase-like Zn-dependent alcohol dehydrogenase